MSKDSETALDRIINEYERSITLFAFSILHDSYLAKEVFLYTIEKAWYNRRKLATFENPAAWLFHVARNKAINYKRKFSKGIPLAGDGLQLNSLSNYPLDAIEAKDLTNHILTAMKLLPSREKEVFFLHVLLGWDYASIASLLQRSPSTIRTQNFNALKKLRKHFGLNFLK